LNFSRRTSFREGMGNVTRDCETLRANLPQKKILLFLIVQARERNGRETTQGGTETKKKKKRKKKKTKPQKTRRGVDKKLGEKGRQQSKRKGRG